MKFDYLIVAGGKKVSRPFLSRCLKASSKVVAIDRGVEQVTRYKADLFVGDGDSTNKKPNAKKAVFLNPQKSVSDLEFAIQHLPKNSKKLIISGHLDHENRVDHAFVNLLIALKYKNIFLADEKNFIIGFTGTYKFKTRKPYLFTVVSPHKNKLSIKGAKYICEQINAAHISFGLSNQTKAKKQVTVVSNKRALLILNTDFSQVI